MGIDAVADHYNSHLDQEWERLDRHRTEFAVTQRALRAYLPLAPARVLDVGSGPGRYAIALSQEGYRLTLVDIAESALAMAAARAQEAGVAFEGILTTEAATMPADWESRYDAVLLFGPLYHLLSHEERLQTVREANRVLKPGGMVFASFIGRFAPIRDLAINSPDWIDEHPQRLAQLLQSGQNPAYNGSAFPDSYFARPEEITPLMEAGGFTTMALMGCEGIVAGHEQLVNEVTGDLWDKWVDLNFELGQEPSLYGAADHLLYIGRKNLDVDD